MASTKSKSVLAEPSATHGGTRARTNDDARANASEQTIARSCLRAYFFVAVWMTISMCVIMFNKWILAYS